MDTSARSLEAYGSSYISWYSLLVLVLGGGTSRSSICGNVSYVSRSRFTETPVKLPSCYFSLTSRLYTDMDSILITIIGILYSCPGTQIGTMSVLYHESLLTQSSLTISDSGRSVAFHVQLAVTSWDNKTKLRSTNGVSLTHCNAHVP